MSLATCGTCVRYTPYNHEKGTCPEHPDQLIGRDRAGCYGYTERVERERPRQNRALWERRMGAVRLEDLV